MGLGMGFEVQLCGAECKTGKHVGSKNNDRGNDSLRLACGIPGE